MSRRCSARSRKRALDVVFAADARNRDPVTVMDERAAAHDEFPPMGDYAEQIVRGMAAHRRRIDPLLAEHSTAGRWTGCPPSTSRSCGSACGN